jgi:2-polyprenyl-3-methyl-5-hydroxy-6-metoxy-1,4-benzoquinol methylase
MERIVEPELMDDPLQARAYAEADFDRSDQAFTERFLALFGQPFPRTGPPVLASASVGSVGDGIVDLGCGPGNISFRLAAALPDSRVLGLDGAANMVALAAEHQQRHPGAWPQLRFEQLKLPLIDPAALGGPFAAVVSNSLLHHLHDPQVLWQAVGQLAAPGATIYIKDLRRPASAVAADALTERHAAGAPALLRRDFRASLAAAFTAAEVEAQLAQAAQLWGAPGSHGTSWPAFTVAEVEDRYLEIHGRWLG